MANSNKISSQDIDWSASTGYGTGTFLGYGGTWSVATGTSPAWSNVIFVAKNGNDTTALAQFTASGNKCALAYPFLTLAGARSAAVSLSPTSTARALIVVFPGLYVEQLILANNVDWDLTTAVIDFQTDSATYTLTDNGVACNSIIYGNAQILRSAGATALGCVNISAGSNVTLYYNTINATIGSGIYNAGTLIAYGNTITAAAYGAVNTAGTSTINGNINSGNTSAYVTGGTQTINGNIVSSASYGANITGGTQTIKGNVTGYNTGAICNNAANQTINGNIIGGNGGAGHGAQLLGSGIQTIIGNITGLDPTNFGYVNQSTGTIIIAGDISSANIYNVVCNSAGNLFLKPGSRLKSTNALANHIPIRLAGFSGKLILDGITIIAKGTGNCISGSTTYNVDIYGTCTTNAFLDPNITIRTGVLQIDSTATATTIGTLVT